MFHTYYVCIHVCMSYMYGIHVLFEAMKHTNFMIFAHHSRLRPEDLSELSVPFNHFCLEEAFNTGYFVSCERKQLCFIQWNGHGEWHNPSLALFQMPHLDQSHTNVAMQIYIFVYFILYLYDIIHSFSFVAMPLMKNLWKHTHDII